MDPRVCAQQVLRKYLFSEGRKEAGRGPVESESGPRSVDVEAPLTSHLPRTPIEMKFPAMTWQRRPTPPALVALSPYLCLENVPGFLLRV